MKNNYHKSVNLILAYKKYRNYKNNCCNKLAKTSIYNKNLKIIN